MNLPEPLIHHSPEHFREPIVGRAENSEDRRHAHNQMEMANHKISIVQRNIQHWLSQERPAESTRYEQRNKSDGESQCRLQGVQRTRTGAARAAATRLCAPSPGRSPPPAARKNSSQDCGRATAEFPRRAARRTPAARE